MGQLMSDYDAEDFVWHDPERGCKEHRVDWARGSEADMVCLKCLLEGVVFLLQSYPRILKQAMRGFFSGKY